MCWSAERLVAILVRAGSEAYRIDSCVEGLQINKQVYSSICERAHTTRVVSGRIDVVYSNGIRSQSLHGGSIELALIRIDQGVGVRQLIRDTCTRISYGRAEEGDGMPLM
jgi:hypothetical protein